MSSAVKDSIDLPEGWKLVTLDDVGEISTGKTPSKTVSEYYTNGTIPFVKPPNLGTDVPITDTEEKITFLGIKNLKLLPKNTIMICCIGSLGKIGIAGTELVTNQQINSIIFNEKKVLFKYGFYYSLTLEEYMNKIANKSVVSIINKSTFSKFLFPLPPLPEQQRIVEKLDSLFANIDTAIALSNENLQHANNLLPAALNEVFENAEEKGWKIEILKNITTKIGSGSTPTGGHNSYKQTGISLIRSMNVYDNGFDRDGLAFIDEIQAKKLDVVTIEEEDVLLNITGASVARCCIVPKEILPARVNQHVSIIRFRKNTVVPKFAHYYFICPIIKNQLLKDSGGGATREAITKSMLENFDITFPDLPTQQRIVNHLNAISTQQQKLQQHYTQQLQQLKALKASLLNAAFKGEL